MSKIASIKLKCLKVEKQESKVNDNYDLYTVEFKQSANKNLKDVINPSGLLTITTLEDKYKEGNEYLLEIKPT